MRRLILPLLALFLATAAAKPDVPAKLDPTKAYVLVEIRNVGPADQPGQYVGGNVTLARYDPAGPDVRGAARSPATAVPPGEALRVVIGVNPLGKDFTEPLVKEKRRRLYFLAVPADRWVIEGAQGTAFSLGSRMFVLEPGKVTDLGVFAPDTDWADGESEGKAMRQTIAKAMFFGIGKSAPTRPAVLRWHVRGAGDMALPATVAALPAATVTYEAAAGFGNYLGGLVNRIGGRAERPAGVATAPAR